MEIFRFKNWNVYKDAKQLFRLILRIVNKLPKEYRYSIGDQLVRAALSVILNIAEGSGKSSDKELNRFFDIVIGSLNEILAAVDVLRDSRLVSISDLEFEEVAQLCYGISKQIGGFKRKIAKQSVISHKL